MRSRSTASAVLPLAFAVVASLSACSALGLDPQVSEPNPVGSQAPTYDASETDSGATSASTLDPDWDTAAQEAEGIFLSMHEDEDDLEFSAVDSSGEIRWTAKRPRVCSGFLVTRSQEGPVAVLMDQDSSLSCKLTTTATGYDLTTGDELWGPVDTPGPLLGNGLVFASPPKDFIGPGGPRIALDPASGETIATDTDDGSSLVIALLADHLVRSQGSDIVGEGLDGSRLWTRPAADFGMTASEAREAPWESIGRSHALIGEAEGQTRTLVDLRSGAVVASDVDEAGFDSESRTLVTAGDHLRGFDDDGAKRWSTFMPENTELAAVGADLIFLDSDSAGSEQAGSDTGRSEHAGSDVARSAQDGKPADDDAPGFDSPLLEASEEFGVPHHIAESGAALIGDPQSPLLVTNEH